MIKKVLIVPLFLFGIVTGCKKESITGGVPNVLVSFTDNIDNGDYPNLAITGGWMYVGGGYDGIIFYRNSLSSFLAYDMCCPYDGATNTKAIVQVQSNNISAVCPVCGSSFLLSDGSAYKGPSSLPLKQYYTSFNDPNLSVSSSPF